MDNSRPPSVRMPTSLAGVLNEVDVRPGEQLRDSAYYSSMDPSSKHNSQQLSNGDVVMAPSPTGYHSSSADISPSPASNHIGNQQLTSPATSGSMSIGSMVSPSPYEHHMAAGQLASLAGHSNRQSYNSGYGTSINGDSRRESVDSRLGTGFQDLRLTSHSPYASNNQSTTSLQSTLQQQRNPGNATDRMSNPRFSNSYQPQRLPEPMSPRSAVPKTAPKITGPATAVIARAAEPIKGEAWAFPEEQIHRVSNSHDRHAEDNQSRAGTSFLNIDSRRSSMADSVASSQYTTESRLPPGQRRLEDGMSSDFRLSRASCEFQNATHHHHSLQNRQGDSLQPEDAESPNNGQPYSRTPELRVSHKLAERKRRTEMKELFETLRDLMPQERGNKASKWEILTKAIADHHANARKIQELEARLQQSQIEAENTRRDCNVVRAENLQLRSELNQSGLNNHQSVMNGFTLNTQQNGGSHVDINPYQQESYAPRGSYTRNEQLPPLRGMSQPESMSGVQFSDMNRNSYPRDHRF